MAEGHFPGTQANDPEALNRALGEAILAAQRLRLDAMAGELIGVRLMYAAAPAPMLDILHAMRPQANDASVLGERLRRAIALMEAHAGAA